MTVIAVVNQKGGVGKTTVVLGLASAAARSGRRVAVVDLDPQANATSGLGVWDPGLTVDDALVSERPGSLRSLLTRADWETEGVVEVAASSPQLARREPELVTDPVGAQDRLRVAAAGMDHDMVFVDCPPSLGLLTVNGLFAADAALVVTEPSAWSSDGVEQVSRTIERISARRGQPVEMLGVVVNRLARTRDSRYWYDQLVETYGAAVMPPVHMRTAVAEAAAQSLPVHGLGNRPGAPEAAAELDALLAEIDHRLTPSAPAAESGGAEVITLPGARPTAAVGHVVHRDEVRLSLPIDTGEPHG